MAFWIIWGDIVKGLPKGRERINDIYVDRLPEAISAYAKAMELDPNLPLIPMKLGTLMLFDALRSKDPDRQRIDDAMKLFKEGRDMYSRYFEHWRSDSNAKLDEKTK